MAKNMLFPPYIAKIGSQNITEAQWTSALEIWTTNLSLLLKMKDENFSKQMLQNVSLQKFLVNFLGIRAKARKSSTEQVDGVTDLELDKKVLAVLLRSSEPKMVTYDEDKSNSSNNKLTLTESLYRKEIVSVPWLLDVVSTYGKSNLVHTKRYFDQTIESAPSLMQDFETHSEVIINYFKAIQEKFQEMAKSYEKASKDSTFDPKKAEEARTYLAYVLDIVITLDCLFTVSKLVAVVFNDKRDFADNIDFLMFLKNFYDDSIPVIASFATESESNNEVVGSLDILRHALVSLAFHTLDACYFGPIGYTTSEDDVYSFVKSDEKLEDDKVNENIVKMQEMFIQLVEHSQPEKPVQSFVDAPMLLDLAIEFDLDGKLTRIKNDVLNGDDAQMEFVLMSLESLRNMNQETDRLPWRVRLEEKQRRILSRVENGHKPLTRIHPANADRVDAIKRQESTAQLSSMISRIHEIFPDLGEGFIEACLVAFDNNVEMVIDQLLQDSLPPHLNELDRSMTRYTPAEVHENPNGEEESPLSQRRNIFDNDEFDVFSGKVLDAKRVIKGKKNRGTADKLLDDKSFVETYKESIIDVCNMMYEDEYDDTYDTSGLKMRGIDLHMVDELDEGSTSQQNVDPSIIHESELIRVFLSDPSVFERNKAARNSGGRARLRNVTQMTDEQLEGWFIMFQRNPKKNIILESYEGNRNAVETPSSESEKTGSRADSPLPESSKFNENHRGAGRGRGRGRGQGRGRGGNNRSGHTNHNRKNAHAKKMGRGFGTIKDQ